MEWTLGPHFEGKYLFLIKMLMFVTAVSGLERRGRTGQSSAPKEKWWGSIFDTSFTVCSSGGGGGGGESFTRLTLCLVCRVTPGRTDQDTPLSSPQHFPGPDGDHQVPQSVLTCRD